MQSPQHRQRITGRARGPGGHTGSSTSRGSSPHSRACTGPPAGRTGAATPAPSYTAPPALPRSGSTAAPRRRQQPRPDHLHPVLPAPQHRIGQQHPRQPAPAHSARRGRTRPVPAEPDQIPLHPDPHRASRPPHPGPSTAAAPTRAEHRQPPRPDLPLAPAPPSAADGPSGQAANLSRAGRSHSVVPTLSPATSTPQAPPVMPTPPDA